MIGRLLSLFRKGPGAAKPSERRKHFFDAMPQAIYAVGDVHGCLDLLRNLEDRIYADGEAIAGEKWIVMLGDYVDRGPKSASVIDHLLSAPQAGFQRLCLAGNHEEAMLDFLKNPSTTHPWMNFGGNETLLSYGVNRLPSNAGKARMLIDSHMPLEHIQFLENLPSLIAVPGFCLVHAGIEPGVPLEKQSDRALLWIRPSPDMPPTDARIGQVVHGHTPVPEVEVASGRVNIDTGAYMSGRLSAARLTPDGGIKPISTI